MDIQYFKKINNAFGVKNSREVEIYNEKREIRKKFESTPLSQFVKINGDERLVIISSSTKNNTKTIISQPDDFFKNGDLVIWKDTSWLICDCDPYDDIYSKGIILKCVSSLRWLDENGEKCEIQFAITNDNISNFGINNERIIELPNERRNIVVSSNSMTDKIHKKQRFIFDGRAWEVTAINKLDEGLNYLTLQEDLIDPARDNTELRIADFYGNVAEYSIRIRNYDVTAIHLGQTLKLEVDLKNRGELIDSSQLTFVVSDESVATVTPEGTITPISIGSVVITASYKEISDSIQLNIIESIVNNYSATITGDNSIKYNMIKSYQCSFANNGMPVKDKSNFWLTDIDGTNPTNLAQIIEQNTEENTCKIRVGKTKGSFLLNVENLSKLAKATHHIDIKSLL